MQQIENVTIHFPCPECNERFRVNLFQLLSGGVVVCPNCQANNADIEIENLERGLESWDTSLKNLRKCLKQNFGLPTENAQS
ncbi:hypothetical protein ACFLVF_03550 [Chloroflexota bacterium]